MEDTKNLPTENAGIKVAEDSSKFRVAICGAGISGLALAALLSKQGDIFIDIYECNDEVRTAGAGIAFWKRFWTTLDSELDFDQVCLEMKTTAPGGWSTVRSPTILKADDGSRKTVPVADVDNGFKSYARQGVLSAFLSMLNPKLCRVHTGHHLKFYTVLRHGSIILMFEPEGPEKVRYCDIFIAADGVHSSVRQKMYEHLPEYAKSTFSGQYAYHMIFSVAALQAKDPCNAALDGFILWSGNDQHFSTSPIGSKIYLTAYENVCSTLSPPRGKDIHTSTPEKVISLAKNWDPDLMSLATCPPLPDKEGHLTTCWAIYTAPPLPSFASGPVALIGDAVHAMMPHQGLGACQGVEDAFVLAKLLGHPFATKGTLEKALEAYDEIRRPAAQRVAQDGKPTGDILDWIHEPCQGLNLEEVGRELEKLTRWFKEGSCEDVAEEAVIIFEKLCAVEY